MFFDGVRRVAIMLAAVDALLVAAYLLHAALGHPSWTLNRLVNLDAEGTVAAWYTSAKLLLAGVVFLAFAVRRWQGRERATPTKAAARLSIAKATDSTRVASATVSPPSGGFSRRNDARDGEVPPRSEVTNAPVGAIHRDTLSPIDPLFLGLVGLVFLFLSLDETVGIHELMTASLRHVAALPRFTGNHGLWIPFLLTGLVIFLVATWKAWQSLWRFDRTGTLLLCLGLVFGLMGAVSLEIVSYVLIRPAGIQTLYILEVALEEGFELLGATVLLIGSAHVSVTDRLSQPEAPGRVMAS